MRKGWKKLPFLEVFEDVSGGNIKTPQGEYLEEGSIPIVDQGKSLIGGFTDDSERICKTKSPVIIFGDHTRIIKYVDFPFAMGADGVKVLKPKIKSNAKYLFYYLSALQIPNAGYDRHFKYLKRTDISLPESEDEQKRIAAVLDKADEVRRKRRQAIKKLDELLQSVFLDMFGDPVSNPKGWEAVKIGEIAPFISSGSTPLGGSSTYLSEGILFIRSQNVLMNAFDFSDAAFISNETHSKMKRTWVKNGDVLFNITGASIGRVHHFTGEDDSANVNQHVSIIRANKSKVKPEYLSRFLSMPSYQSKIMTGNAGATRQAFNFEQIRNFPFLLPPLEKQENFIKVSEKIENLKNDILEAETKAENLFHSLQQRAFTGELFEAAESASKK